jgi:hypothetical protein
MENSYEMKEPENPAWWRNKRLRIIGHSSRASEVAGL